MDETTTSHKAHIVVLALTILFILVSWLSVSSIAQLQGNARVINYVGIVRGATQRLVKKELQSHPDNALMNRINGIVRELITGNGMNGLIILHDDTYLENMNMVARRWEEIKKEIAVVRSGGDTAHLFALSEEYFILVDRAVSAAEAFSETRVIRSRRIIFAVNVVFVGILVIGFVHYLRSCVLKRRAEQLRRIAYNDPLTRLPNRAGCERELHSLNPESTPNNLGIFVFDMNGLKRINDVLGHSGGDQVIADFAGLLRDAMEGFGFVGRYGGDEFVAVIRNADELVAERFLTRLNEKIVAYNILHMNDIEKISFAVGYCIGNLKTTDVVSLLDEADRRMYLKKRQMKEAWD